MATERLSMRKPLEILRQKWLLARSHRDVVASLGVSAEILGKSHVRAVKSGMGEWSQLEALSHCNFEQDRSVRPEGPAAQRAMPKLPCIGRERKKVGAALKLPRVRCPIQHPDACLSDVGPSIPRCTARRRKCQLSGSSSRPLSTKSRASEHLSRCIASHAIREKSSAPASSCL